MAAIMPLIPRIFFGYVEPCLVGFGALQPLLNPQSITQLLPARLTGHTPSDPNPTALELLLALQGSTLSFMLVLLNIVIMRYSTQRSVVHGFVWASLITDFPWWASLAYCLGQDGMTEWRTWPGGLWAQWIVPALTFLIKVGYLSGLFGKDRIREKAMKKE